MVTALIPRAPFRWERAIVFVPSQAGERDIITAFHRSIGLRERTLARILRLTGVEVTFSSFCHAYRANWRPRRLLLFGHYDGLAPGFRTSTPDKLLLHRFWNGNDERYAFLFAYVCQGARLLRRPLWRQTFQQWLAFDGSPSALVATVRGAQVWERVLHRIVMEWATDRVSSQMKSEVILVFEEAMEWLYDGYDASQGDTANIVFLQQCIDYLKCDKDA